MAKRLQHRGGTTSQHSTFTGAVREVTVDTDKNTLVVHDGATAGGHPLATATNFASTGIDDNATTTSLTLTNTSATLPGSLTLNHGSANANPRITFEQDNITGSSFIEVDRNTKAMEFYNNGSERFRVTSAGNVGIGTSSPSTVLDVRDETNGANFIVGGSGTTNITKIGGGAGDSLQLFTNSTTPVMLLSTSGNVGIGTSSPANNLHIFTDASGEGITVKSTGNTYNDIVGDANRSGAGNNLVRFRGNWNGNPVAMIVISAGDDTTNKDDGRLQFFTSASGSIQNERMVIEPNGNVGIGTSSPSSLLHIFSSAPKLIIQDGGTHGTNSAPRLEFKDSSSIQGFVEFADDGTMRIDQLKANPLTFLTNNVERMRIDSSGNVGIGTSSTQGRLLIKTNTSGSTANPSLITSGHISFSNASGATALPTIMGRSDNNGGLQLMGATSNAPSVADLFFDIRENDNTDYATTTGYGFRFSRYGSELMRLTRDGNLGIGLTDPDQNLEVQGRSHLNGTVYSEVFNASVAADTWTTVKTMGSDEGFQVFACAPGASANDSRFASALVFKGGIDAPLMTVLEGSGTYINLRVSGNDVQVYRSSNLGGGSRNTRVTFLKVAYV